VPGLLPMAVAQLGEPGEALTLARRVSGDDSDFMTYLFSRQGAALRAQPQYAAFVESEGLTRLWATYGPPDLR
jgi:hypothetical protein